MNITTLNIAFEAAVGAFTAALVNDVERSELEAQLKTFQIRKLNEPTSKQTIETLSMGSSRIILKSLAGKTLWVSPIVRSINLLSLISALDSISYQ
ncbi:hypothetical protein HGT70_14325 [Rosenbergiella collisarenosi]|uniref:hypothetical protein n=1 Tax=Rosenbergiella collisarenosi TaxID=1544695 RepID=UPI001BD96FD2|nr:hypothetical protein [Rosenbergiella collisarenosi]MBT0722450.1 hypothetical protein [Rosenbergiella collisarenosi]